MKQITLTICAAALLLTACNNSKKSDDGKKDTPSDTAAKMNEKNPEAMAMPDSATMMKNWQEYMTPGAVHKMMATWDGTWNGEVTMWMYPGAPEQKSKSTAVNKMIMNGLYQESNHSGDMMGMPFNGKSTVAYDNHRNEFVSTWIDNMGSGIMVLKGPWDEATKTITLKGKMVDPGTKQDTDVRETFKINDDNTQEMEMFVMMPDGKEFKTMNIKYTRKK
ncbi:MAG: DUF1579 domain-containing protein [Chitinophagaceae bacterium]